jgi:hypothetical protein
MEFDLTQFAAHLCRLESEMSRKPALKCFLDADLDHNLCALRFAGVLPKESAPAAAVSAEPPTRRNRHGGSRQGAGRKRIHASKIGLKISRRGIT